MYYNNHERANLPFLENIIKAIILEIDPKIQTARGPYFIAKAYHLHSGIGLAVVAIAEFKIVDVILDVQLVSITALSTVWLNEAFILNLE